MRLSVRYVVLLILLLTSVARAAETQTQYLSGLGKDDPVKWQFKCDKGQNANAWSTIGVRSEEPRVGLEFRRVLFRSRELPRLKLSICRAWVRTTPSSGNSSATKAKTQMPGPRLVLDRKSPG